MIPFIIIFGALTCLSGILITVNPKLIFGFLQRNSQKIELHIAAVVIRLVLGILLISQADVARYPITLEIIGGLSISAALFFAIIGRNNFKNLMSWALSLDKKLRRIGGVFAALFGAFLLHAFI